jgi:hypothetical protein
MHDKPSGQRRSGRHAHCPVNFELLPYNFVPPGDASPDYITINDSGAYTIGVAGTATPVIRDSLALKNGTAYVGLDQVASDHTVIDTVQDSKKPAGATITYRITGGNDEGMFILTSGGNFLLAPGKNAAMATGTKYSLQIQGVGTFDDGTQTNVSTATETITIGPSIGVYGDTMAQRGTDDTIDLTFIRFATNMSASLAVNFTVHWSSKTDGIGAASAADIVQDESYYNQLVVVDDTHGRVTIPAGYPTTTMVLYAATLDGDPKGIVSFYITLDPSSAGGVTYEPVHSGSSLGDKNADIASWYQNLYILDGVTAFAAYNGSKDLRDDPYGDGIDPNDVMQKGLGDCYFMAAEMALARSNPQAIENDITQNSGGSFTVKIYNNPAAPRAGSTQTGWISYTFAADSILTNGWAMAGLSGDYNSFTGNVEIWPQLLEAAWMKLNGGTYQGISSGTTSDALIALTGLPYTFIPLVGMTNQQIGHSIQQELATGAPVAIGTFQDTFGKKGSFSLFPATGNVYYDHAYVVESVNTDVDGNIVSVTLLNPWGWPSKDDYKITVPIADFSALFANIFCLP